MRPNKPSRNKGTRHQISGIPGCIGRLAILWRSKYAEGWLPENQVRQILVQTPSTKFQQNPINGLREHADTETTSPLCVHLMCFVKRTR